MTYPIAKTILILAANPKGTSPLRLDQEVRDICEGLQRSPFQNHFRIESRWAVRPRDVRLALLQVNPQIVHFCGHGFGDEGLAFETESGAVQLVGAEALAGLFELFADQIECVVLNACYSEVQAEVIGQYIPAVIGMKRAIGDRAAIEFAVGFYDAIAAGRPIAFAYRMGCSAIHMAGIPETLTPILKQKIPTSPSPITDYPLPTHPQKQRLTQRRNILAAERDLRTEKLLQFRESWAIEAGAAMKFQLQKQIQEEEAQIQKLEEQIGAIERELEDG